MENLNIPGKCETTITVTTFDAGIYDAPTSCTFRDSALVRISAIGSLTVTSNPDHSCCFSGATYPLAGTYGPMGGGTETNWLMLQVQIGFRFADSTRSGWMYSGFSSFGSTADFIKIWESVINLKDSAFVHIRRVGLQGSGSCTTTPAAPWLPPVPPNCLLPGGGYGYTYSAWMYNHMGTQRIVVEHIATDLVVTASDNAPVEGDTVVFTGTSVAGTVSAREWLWRDATGSTTVPCTGTSPVCSFVPPRTGAMFLRAQVGSAPIIQQAHGEVTVTPTVLVATVDRAGGTCQ